MWRSGAGPASPRDACTIACTVSDGREETRRWVKAHRAPGAILVTFLKAGKLLKVSGSGGWRPVLTEEAPQQPGRRARQGEQASRAAADPLAVGTSAAGAPAARTQPAPVLAPLEARQRGPAGPWSQAARPTRPVSQCALHSG